MQSLSTKGNSPNMSRVGLPGDTCRPEWAVRNSDVEYEFESSASPGFFKLRSTGSCTCFEDIPGCRVSKLLCGGIASSRGGGWEACVWCSVEREVSLISPNSKLYKASKDFFLDAGAKIIRELVEIRTIR